ncbi:hypothetical protein KCTCHS21_12340 [Cohnella abietis]|uniref:5-formyltetrahydrofolate cyclo-ligase n=1 Tax=Cohnella abietis TaxID=2507935 RepID=A0A3T1D1F3_9BACL|nr:hypothetical protein KCTCHS21_12340 [Cohnella abietis]
MRKVEALTNWIPGKWGVPEPDPLQTLLAEQSQALDVVLVPGLAFTKEGSRLGYGGGYYDRLYADRLGFSNPKTLWIGFAFANQVIADPLPMETHDLPLDGLATNEQVIWFN